MLRHMINRMHAMKDGDNGEDDDDVPELPPPVLDYETVTAPYASSSACDTSSTSSFSRLRKARRLTSTPRELLGSLENVATQKAEFLNPNDLQLGGFVRGTRQTQSLRIPTIRNRRSTTNLWFLLLKFKTN